MAEWSRRLTRKPKVRTAVGSNLALDSLVAVRNSSPGRPVPCEGNLVAVAGSCGGLMVKHPWPLLEISLSDFHRLATLNINTYLPTFYFKPWLFKLKISRKPPDNLVRSLKNHLKIIKCWSGVHVQGSCKNLNSVVRT